MSTQPVVAPRTSTTTTSCRCTASTTSSCMSATRCRPRYFYAHALGFREVAYAGLETGVRDRDVARARAGPHPARAHRRATPGHEIGAHQAAHGDGVQGDRPLGPRRRRTPTARPTSAAPPACASRGRRPTSTARSASRQIATYGETLHTFVDRSDYKGAFLPRLRAARRAAPATPACSRSTTSSATSSSANGRRGSSTTRTSSG